MTDDIFNAPGGMGVDWKTLYGRLLAIFPTGEKEVINTRYGLADSVRGDLYDIDAGRVVTLDAPLFGRALVRQISGIERGKAVVGRLTQGQAQGGQNAPWLLSDPTPEDYAKVRAYFAAHPARSMKGPQTPVQPAQPPAAPTPTPTPAAAPAAQVEGVPVTQWPPQPQPTYTPPPPPPAQAEPPF